MARSAFFLVIAFALLSGPATAPGKTEKKEKVPKATATFGGTVTALNMATASMTVTRAAPTQASSKSKKKTPSLPADEKTFRIHSAATFTLNGGACALTDLQIGDVVIVAYNGEAAEPIAVQVTIYRKTIGMVKEVNAEKGTFVVESHGQVMEFTAGGATKLKIGSEFKSLADLAVVVYVEVTSHDNDGKRLAGDINVVDKPNDPSTTPLPATTSTNSPAGAAKTGTPTSKKGTK